MKESVRIPASSIRFENVRLSRSIGLFNSATLLKNFSAEITSGETVALLSSQQGTGLAILQALMGLRKIVDGFLFYNDEAVSRIDQKNFSFVAESPSYPHQIKVKHALSNKICDAKLRKESKKIILDALSFFGILDLSELTFSKLRKNQVKLVAMAEAMISGGEFIFLDHPHTNLDFGSQGLFLEWFRSCQQTGKTILVATDHTEFVVKYCERRIVLNPPGLKSLYVLRISGVSKSSLVTFREQYGLPGWITDHSRGFVVSLYFSDYPGAAEWLKFCLNAGHIVLEFSEDLAGPRLFETLRLTEGQTHDLI